jgi:hypothetical protein
MNTSVYDGTSDLPGRDVWTLSSTPGNIHSIWVYRSVFTFSVNRSKWFGSLDSGWIKKTVWNKSSMNKLTLRMNIFILMLFDIFPCWFVQGSWWFSWSVYFSNHCKKKKRKKKGWIFVCFLSSFSILDEVVTLNCPASFPQAKLVLYFSRTYLVMSKKSCPPPPNNSTFCWQ